VQRSVRLAPTLIGVASLVASLVTVGFASAGGPGVDGGTDGGTADGGKVLAPSGAPCKQHADCRSNACISGICRSRCDATTKCAATQTCTKIGVCMPNDAGTAPTEPSVPPAPTTKKSSGDDDEDGIVKDEEYWRRMPTTLEPPPDNRPGCSSSPSPIAPFTGTAILFAVTCTLLRRRRRP
jgi:hypothetical protein